MRDVPTFGPPLEGLGIYPTRGAPSQGAPFEDAINLRTLVGGWWRWLFGGGEVAGYVADEREIAVVVGSEINVCE